jgi:hypothetical protein
MSKFWGVILFLLWVFVIAVIFGVYASLEYGW